MDIWKHISESELIHLLLQGHDGRWLCSLPSSNTHSLYTPPGCWFTQSCDYIHAPLIKAFQWLIPKLSPSVLNSWLHSWIRPLRHESTTACGWRNSSQQMEMECGGCTHTSDRHQRSNESSTCLQASPQCQQIHTHAHSQPGDKHPR